MEIQNLARLFQDGFKILQEFCKMDAKLARILQDGYKSCKNLARKMEELCIPLQDLVCKILNFDITRDSVVFQFLTQSSQISIQMLNNFLHNFLEKSFGDSGIP